MFCRLEELQVLDIKFLYGCPKPTIVVLYQVQASIYILASLKFACYFIHDIPIAVFFWDVYLDI